MKIDASLLRPGYHHHKDGFYAEFAADGQLIHFGYYENGQPQGWVIDLDPQQRRGQAQWVQAFSDEQEHVSSDDGTEDDPDGAIAGEADAFRFWVEAQIQAIYDARDYAPRCSFCEKNQSEVAKLIAGPQVYICNECIGLCNEILDAEAQPSG
jgi:hypothetical protein